MELPKGWKRLLLRDVVGLDGLFADGDWIESKDQDPDGEVRLIQLADVGVGRFLNKSSRFMTRAKAVALGCTFLEANDVLISRMADPIGRACTFPGFPYPCVTVVDVCIVRPRDALDGRWLVNALNSEAFKQRVELAASGTTRARVSRSNLGALDIPVPPLPEQRRIVAKLDSLQARSRRAKEALDAIPPLLERLRQSVLASAFRGDLTAEWRAKNPDVEPAAELLKRIRVERRRKWEEAELAKMVAKGKRPGDDRWKARFVEPAAVDAAGLPELPRGWCWASVDEVAVDSRIGLVRGTSDQSDSRAYRYVRMQNFDLSGQWHFDDVVRVDASPFEFNEYEMKTGDVLFNTRNSSELVGKVAIWPAGRPGHLFNNNLMRLRFTHPVSSLWVGWQMSAPFFRAAMARIRSATTSVAAIYGRDLFRQPLAIAPPLEQAEALKRIQMHQRANSECRALLTVAGKQRETLDRAILAKAFRGELVPQDPREALEVEAPHPVVSLRSGEGHVVESRRGKAPKRGR